MSNQPTDKWTYMKDVIIVLCMVVVLTLVYTGAIICAYELTKGFWK